ncbi:fusarubin cluster-oxidoreductase [Meristemomyces frigidus]|uniref:Fusarubin cluster-oxidoreductase n=1 Tax=Meristemomyces frigidus TaxID=1508187 RepID=A0AAN7TCU4_9PEZI|nr:fusarubin cluster-oxidoreductase [Meristemomyces frigidus]
MSATKRLSALSNQLRTASTMKEAVVAAGPKVSIIDSPVPKPGPGQVVTKVVFSGSNPKDWKRAENPVNKDAKPLNQGDDIAGIVHEVGPDVSEFKPGDRVAAFHEMMTPGGSYAEYALSWAHTTFYLPEKTTFEEGAALPLAAMTAAVGLYARMRLPEPWFPLPSDNSTQLPLVIYGASSAVGSYAIQFAQRSNIHPLICIAGRARSHVQSLISPEKGDVIVDYRDGNEAVIKGIRDALKGQKLHYAYDAVSEKGSYQNICAVLEPEGKITNVLPGKKYAEIPASVQKSLTTVGSVHQDLKDFAYVYFRYISKGLEEGWFKAHPQEVVPGGLEGVETGLMNLKEGKASAVKYVFRIADTPGISD